MKKSIFLVTALLTIVPISCAKAQTTSSSVNQLLYETNQLIRDIEPEIQQMEEESKRNRASLNLLFQACMNGNQLACKEHNQRMDKINRRLDVMIQQTNPHNLQNRRWAESFCHPYCN